MVAETEEADDIPEYFLLEAIGWLPDGGLVYSWQVTGIGGYILFFGWSSVYRFRPGTAAVAALAPLHIERSAPCWSDVTGDGAYALGACGGEARIVERMVDTGAASLIPLLPGQGQAGAAGLASLRQSLRLRHRPRESGRRTWGGHPGAGARSGSGFPRLARPRRVRPSGVA
jgi:hypothetical protein